MAKDLTPTKYKYTDELIEGVYFGIISVNDLPESLFEFTYLNSMGGVVLGYGDVSEAVFKVKRLRDYKLNMSFFSGAKTWQEVNELSLNMFDANGQKIGFSKFKKIALGINANYNVNFLKTELNTGFGVAQGARHWDDIEENKELLPMLQYQTIGDSHVRPEHASFDNIIKPVDSDFWSSHMPPNDWGCRCTVIQLEKGKETDLDEHLKKYNASVPEDQRVESLENTSKIFKQNPGKTDYIYPSSHPYYDIPKEFQKAAEDNFGFTTPSNEELLKHTQKIK
jgi:hypothetical protein